VPFKIIKPDAAPRLALEPGRGYSLRLVDTGIGVESLDLHLNVLAPGGSHGRLHRHSRSDMKSGEGLLTIENEDRVVVANDVVFIPDGTRHAFKVVTSVRNVTEGRVPTMLCEGARRFCKRPGALPCPSRPHPLRIRSSS
jgi:quercetin dioxygenase-like cupin family protein